MLPGKCAPGFYCPRNTTVQIPCPAGRYGKTAGLTSAECTAICPIGHYCVAGSVEPVKCPSGSNRDYCVLNTGMFL